LPTQTPGRTPVCFTLIVDNADAAFARALAAARMPVMDQFHRFRSGP
jgi:hypothetical protein